MKPDPASRALNAVFRDLLATRDGATYMAARVWGIHTHYDLGGAHPLVGSGVPSFELEDGTVISDLMHDGCGILLDFESNAPLKALAHKFRGLKYISGWAKEQFGLSAVLIRPDGIVAWAAGNASDASELQNAAARWFIRTSSARP